MEYYKCAETGLTYSNTGTGKGGGRDPNTMMLVVVETLEGQSKFIFRCKELFLMCKKI